MTRHEVYGGVEAGLLLAQGSLNLGQVLVDEGFIDADVVATPVETGERG